MAEIDNIAVICGKFQIARMGRRSGVPQRHDELKRLSLSELQAVLLRCQSAHRRRPLPSPSS